MQPATNSTLNPTLDLTTYGPKGSLPAFDPTTILPVVFTLVFAVWAIYTLIVIYHWFRYGHKSWLTVPALVMHLVVSAFIILFAASGLR